MTTRDKKARIEEIAEGYDDAKDEEFNNQFVDMFKSISKTNTSSKVTQDDIQGFLDSFTFEDEGDWCWTQLNNEIADAGDAKYEQMRDER